MLQILASIDTSATYTCGDIGLKFSGMLPYVVSMAITIIKIVVPILLIIFGIILTIIVFLFKEDLLWLFGASKSTISYANDYMGIYLFCINWFGDEQFY